jgi:hypothetical protein
VGLRIAWLAEQHVPAKRYLVATDIQYQPQLTKVSARTLIAQGGPMNDQEIATFRANPDWPTAVRLRDLDDRAKIPGALVPGLDEYRADLTEVVARAACTLRFWPALAEHYAGNDSNLPTLGRGYLECAYAPMVELLGYLQANGFSNYIASGGGRDFMRPISQQVYGIPRERVIGSATTFKYTSNDHGGMITHEAQADYLDDGPQKPIRIWSRVGRRPLLAAGSAGPGND